MSVVKAADAVGVSGQTGYNWQERWNAEGFDGLVPRYAGDHPPKLTNEQKAELLEMLREKSHWTTVEAQRLIQSHFGVAYSQDQVRRILKSFGRYYGKPYPRDHRRPADAKALLKKIPADEQAYGAWVPGRVSPQTTANTQRMWSFDHPPLAKNTKKIRANTFGILAVNGTSIVTFRERSKQEDIREVLKAYKKANPGKRLVVLDNFSSHHAVLVRQYTAGDNIQLAHLPPDSPDLNPIEQVWRAIKREVSATFVRDYEHMTTTIARAFEKLAAKRTYWEKWVQTFLSPRYASKILSQ